MTYGHSHWLHRALRHSSVGSRFLQYLRGFSRRFLTSLDASGGARKRRFATGNDTKPGRRPGRLAALQSHHRDSLEVAS